MSEIEKMYKNVGFIQKQCKDYSCIVCDKNKDCDKYPPFTAEKQIELIKWLGSKYGLYIVDKYSIGVLVGEYVEEFCTKKNFEDALAGTTNYLWQSLTEEEKEALRGILRA